MNEIEMTHLLDSRFTQYVLHTYAWILYKLIKTDMKA